MNRRTTLISLLIFILILALFYTFSPDFRLALSEQLELAESVSYDLSKNAVVHIIDVGQGDSILLQSGSYNMLVDAGPNSAEESLVQYLDSLGIKKLDCVVLTHPHEDHIGGADLVLNRFGADTLLMPDCSADSRAFENILDIAEEKDIRISIPERGDVFSLGELDFTVLAPGNKSYKETNDYSIVLKAEYGETSFVLTGDAEALSEYEILEAFDKDFLKCDLLKVGHHGSSSSSSKEFVQTLSPEFAAISCGYDNDYGHPHRETRALLDNEGIEYYRTDYDGTLVFVSDKKSVWLG
ncbi:MAG: MBL fold metallo-hydrolase [Clostridia bacterium]|nr:MBL fold metallo-hydrolase [Clostridia bacterium]